MDSARKSLDSPPRITLHAMRGLGPSHLVRSVNARFSHAQANAFCARLRLRLFGNWARRVLFERRSFDGPGRPREYRGSECRRPSFVGHSGALGRSSCRRRRDRDSGTPPAQEPCRGRRGARRRQQSGQPPIWPFSDRRRLRREVRAKRRGRRGHSCSPRGQRSSSDPRAGQPDLRRRDRNRGADQSRVLDPARALRSR